MIITKTIDVVMDLNVGRKPDTEVAQERPTHTDFSHSELRRRVGKGAAY